MLDGEAALEAGGVPCRFCRGEALHVPSGVVHQKCNEGVAVVRFIVGSMPESHGDRVAVGSATQNDMK